MKRLINAATGILMCISPLLYSCEKDPLIPAHAENTSTTVSTEYYIKQGNHYCEQNQAELMFDTTINATVVFDSSAIYTSLTIENQGDVNKLIGFSDGGTNHQENSARLGWSWNGQKVVLYAYAYVNKVRIIKTIALADINQEVTCAVQAKTDYYSFTVNGVTDTVQRYSAGYTGLRYKLFPYFGGDEAAPHDVRIKITERITTKESVK